MSSVVSLVSDGKAPFPSAGGDTIVEFRYHQRMETPKQEKFRLVEESVLESVTKLGRSIKISRVAEKAKVSRAWIYKYFGDAPDEIILESIRQAGRRFAELDRTAEFQSVDQLLAHYRQIILLILEDAEKYPWIPELYFRFFGSPCGIGNALGSIEAEFSENLKRHCQQLGLAIESSQELSKIVPKSIMVSAFSLNTDSYFRAMGREKIAEIILRTLRLGLGS